MIVTCEQSSGNLCRRRALLAGQLASQSGLLQFAVTFLKDHVFESLKLVGRGDVPDRGMEPDAVVAVDGRGDSTASLLAGTREVRPNALVSQTAVPAFELAVGLGETGWRRPVGERDPGPAAGELGGDPDDRKEATGSGVHS